MAYTAKDIGVLDYPDNVRKRPGMFLGSEGQPGAQRAAQEILDNSSDEYKAGYGKIITVCYSPTSHVMMVVDQGRGIPVEMHAKTHESALTTVFTRLNAGGKFTDSSYKYASGLHGVGAACTNAVSDLFEVWTYRKHWYYQKFACGIAQTAVIKANPPSGLAAQKQGTVVRFHLDPKIYKDHYIDPQQLLYACRDAAAVNPGLEVRLIVGEKRLRFLLEEGLVSMVTGAAVHSQAPALGKPFHYVKTNVIDVAICWYDDQEEIIRSYVNGSYTVYGGSHVNGFRSALVRALREESNQDFEARYWTKGMRAAFNWNMDDPVYEGQTKGLLASDVEAQVRDAIYAPLALWLKQNPALVKMLVSRASAYKSSEDKFKAETKAIKGLKLSSPDTRGLLPGKLAQAIGYTRDERELIIVEGDSASGSCFIGETPVRLADGTLKTFAELVADNVAGVSNYGLAYDVATRSSRRVLLEDPRLTRYTDTLVVVTLTSGLSFRCTPEHLVLLHNGKYISAASLQSGNQLMSPALLPAVVSGAALIHLTEKIPVYDLTVPTYENFALGVDVYAHNCKKARMPWQEILPIRGKILNPAKTTFSEFMKSEAIQMIFQAAGVMPGDPYDVKTRRVSRIMVLTDADPDGKHICALILMLAGMYMRPWLDGGHIFYIDSPLFVGSYKEERQFGFSADEMLLNFEAKVRSKVLVSRLKGHGEANASDVHRYAMDPATRRIIRFTATDADVARAQHVMGKDVSYRRTLLGLQEAAR